jgi:hypothetical protein
MAGRHLGALGIGDIALALVTTGSDVLLAGFQKILNLFDLSLVGLIREYYKSQDPETPEQILELVPVDHGRPDGRIITPAFLLISRKTNNP